MNYELPLWTRGILQWIITLRLPTGSSSQQYCMRQMSRKHLGIVNPIYNVGGRKHRDLIHDCIKQHIY
jgi:hypothetical protein